MKLFPAVAVSALGLVALKMAGDAAVQRFETLRLDDIEPAGDLYEVDGQRFHVLQAGNGPALVLLHGLGDSVVRWRENIAVLSQHFRVVAIDLAGHGLSTRSAPDLSLAGHTAAIKSLLDELGIARATVVGHSMGGSIAQRLAATWPDLVEKLVLISSTTDDYMLRAAWASRLMAPFIPAFVALLHSPFVRRLHLRLIVANPADVDAALDEESRAPTRIRRQTRCYQQLMVDRTRDVRTDLGSIRAPTLIVWGDRDRLVSIKNGDRLARAIPNSRLVVIPNAGHLVPDEQPAALNRLILEFAGAKAGVSAKTAKA